MPVRTRWRVPPLVRDVLLLVVGALVATYFENWRDDRTRSRRDEVARHALVAELDANASAVTRARAHHLAVVDTLRGYLARHQVPPDRVVQGGIFNPARLSATAWTAARESGALADTPYEQSLAIAAVYDAQESYRALGSAMAQAIMTDMLRDGVDHALRDRAFNFITIDQDFSNREWVLERAYHEASALLAGSASASSARPTAKPR